MIDLSSELNVLTLTMVGEARGQGASEMQCVANVIMNRVASPRWWGNNILSVCLKPWQFDCWDEDDANRAYIEHVSSDDPIVVVARAIAQRAIDGTLDDPTDGATYYYAKSMKTPPSWAEGKTPCFETATQLYFNDID